MDWGTFFTWVGQGLIVVAIVFVLAAAITAIVQAERAKKSNRKQDQ